MADQVVPWTPERLRCAAFAAFMHDGARTFIDGIDPKGTLNRDNHVRAGKIYAELAPYEPFGGGEYLHDIGIYISFDSFISLCENGREVASMGYNFSPTRAHAEPEMHRTTALGICRALLQQHLQFGIVTSKDLDRLENYRAIILPNVVMISEREAEAFRRYVAGGGNLYVSRNTSKISSDGVGQKDFMLADVLGISYEGETAEKVTFAAPTGRGKPLFGDFNASYPVSLMYPMNKVRAHEGCEVLATITLPYTLSTDSRYSSMLSNPPGIATDYPAMTLNRFGKGSAVYAAGAFELWGYETQRDILCRIMKMLVPEPLLITDAPRPVEITLFDQPHNRRLLVHAMNFQQELPNIPIGKFGVRVRADGRIPKRISVVPGNMEITFAVRDGYIEFSCPRLETYRLIQAQY
jgi:hypothetical protein